MSNSTVFRNQNNKDSKVNDRGSVILQNEQLDELKEKFIKVIIDFF